MGFLRDLGLGLLAAEVYVHASPLARWIVERAIAHLPSEERERRREEWLADLDDMPDAVEKLLWALGCVQAATVTSFWAWRTAHPHLVRSTIERWNDRVNALPMRRRVLVLFFGGSILGGIIGATIDASLETDLVSPGFAMFLGVNTGAISYLTYLIFRPGSPRRKRLD